jgi:carbamoylphosphate synthase large subunit
MMKIKVLSPPLNISCVMLLNLSLSL